jgi:hypothetical protein
VIVAPVLTTEALEKIGVRSMGHQRKIIRLIEKGLKEKEATPATVA